MLNKAHESCFRKIVDLLLKEYVIETKNEHYRLIEIEFYDHSAAHTDTAAYGYVDDKKKYNERVLWHKATQEKKQKNDWTKITTALQ